MKLMSLKEFGMKPLKGCFAQQYNRRHKRHGNPVVGAFQ